MIKFIKEIFLPKLTKFQLGFFYCGLGLTLAIAGDIYNLTALGVLSLVCGLAAIVAFLSTLGN